MARILVVDDETNLRAAIVGLLRARGFEVEAAATGEDALELQQRVRSDLVVLDIVLPGLSGLETFRLLRQADPALMCVFITAHGSVPAAVEAMRAGGYDYLTKPFDNDHLVLTVERALEQGRLITRVTELEQDLSARSEFASIVGRSDAVQQVLRRLAKVSASDTTVVLSGESGTGKELAARSIHRASPRANRPFVAINCGAIPATLAESELFGHERGSFTDAKGVRLGRFEQAQGGTLFLDEVGDLTSEVQVKLLRAIQEREIYRVGGDEPIHVDVRLIAATNRSLTHDVSTGRFRDDLYWRLNEFQVEMPPLRDRHGDLPLLLDYLLDRINEKCRTTVTGVAPSTLERLAHYPWPGNIRELHNVLRHSAIMAEASLIQIGDLPEYVVATALDAQHAAVPAETLEHARALSERQLVEATLRRFRGNRSATAAALGIDRRTLYNKLRQYKDASARTPAT